MPFFGNANARPDVVPDPFPSPAGLDAGEDVKAGFEPGRKPMRDFNSLMKRMIIRKHAIHTVPVAIESIVAVQFDHGFAARNSFGAVNLDFIAVLGARGNDGGEIY